MDFKETNNVFHILSDERLLNVSVEHFRPTPTLRESKCHVCVKYLKEKKDGNLSIYLTL